jgi:hypothetical protein
MRRDHEKPATSTIKAALTERIDITMTRLGIISIFTILALSIMVAVGSPWSWRVILTLITAAFDAILLYEATFKIIDALRSGDARRLPHWSMVVSSLFPFLLVSGPFLAAWLMDDQHALALRGFMLGDQPLGAFHTIVILRLLRLTRPFFYRAADGRPRLPLSRAGLAGLATVIIASIAMDALILPSWQAVWIQDRIDDAERISLQYSVRDSTPPALPERVLAVIVEGQIIRKAPRTISPSDYLVIELPRATIWFNTAPMQRARSMAEIVVLLASLVASLAWTMSSNGSGREQVGTEPPAGQLTDIRRNLPTGREEIAGILGKDF